MNNQWIEPWPFFRFEDFRDCIGVKRIRGQAINRLGW